jgi:hypothetical protein
MTTALAKTDFHAISVIEVARELLGPEDERSNGAEKHFSGHGGLFVNTELNKWYSHGNGKGGDALDLVRFINECDFQEGTAWLRSQGHIEQPLTVDRLVETYTYGEGRGCYYVDRYDPKRFTQWREHNGERVNGTAAGDYQRRYPDGPWYRVKGKPRHNTETLVLPAVTPVLYREAELLESGNKTVLIASGEKDVDNLRALGFTATTNHGGEGNWWPELSPRFKGRRVLILSDGSDSQIAE